MPRHRAATATIAAVPDALSADVAAKEGYEHDKSLTRHEFTEGEHPIIRIEHLNKTFDGVVPVLRDVNLNVWPGEVVVVLGPSGSGKSTMLRCINLLEVPTAGHILINDNEITGTDETDVVKLRQHLGMVFQNFNLFPHLTAKENVMLAPVKVLKKSKKEAEKEALKQLDAVGLADALTSSRRSFPADSSSVSQSRAPWRCTQKSCCSMSRRAPLILSWSAASSTLSVTSLRIRR